MIKTHKRLVWFYFVMLLTKLAVSQQEQFVDNDRELKNISAFAKAYGVVRFFYPNESLRNLNWDDFLTYGIDNVKPVKNTSELKTTLEKLFKPVAPFVSFSETKPLSFNSIKINHGDSIVFWQHQDFTLVGENEGAKEAIDAIGKLVRAKFDSLLVINKENPYTQPKPDLTNLEYYNFNRVFNETNYFLSRNVTEYLLKIQPDPLNAYVSEIIPGLWIKSPCVLPIKLDSLYSSNHALISLTDTLKDYTKKQPSQSQTVFYADYVYMWNIINHFYAYKKRAELLQGFNWDNQLYAGLKKMSSVKTINEATGVIKKAVQLFNDPHSDVYNLSGITPGNDGRRWLPFGIEAAGDRVFITKSIDPLIFKGDELLEIGRKPVKFLIDSLHESYFGPYRVKRAKAIHYLGFSRQPVLKLKIKRDDKEFELDVNTLSHKEYAKLKLRVNIHEHKPIEQLTPSVVYINFGIASEDELEATLLKLQKTDHLIIDLRDYPINYKSLYKHLVKTDFGKGLIGSAPIYMYPDQVLAYYIFRMPLDIPEKPTIRAKISVLINPLTQSRGETLTSMLKDQGATLYGDTTAGAAGGINWFTTPGKITFQLTSSYYLRQNMDEMQICGIKPDYFIKPDLKSLLAGKDGVLDSVLKELLRK